MFSRLGFFAAFICIVASASSASAQTLTFDRATLAIDPATLEVDVSADAELASIDAEAQAATALYVTATVLHVGGLAAGTIVAVGHSIGCAFGGSCDGGGYLIGAVVSLSAAALGLLLYVPAIALDVDSGVRRRAWRERQSISFGAAPTEGGAAFSLSGSF
ncbi:MULTISPECIES: hypothetical protein [Sandaracinus]|uniref:hypothetical protein n=1 Tax=Sandaracinus TaxID=1055688 RepID=UPI0019D45A80|nr:MULTISPECIES: hypothetical protein [Sandaracinus]QRN75796.1 Hypothetical protein MSR10575_88830 [Sandaracinus sp.]UJR87315.1 Hypothetical protein I5071_1070 [Sandaracinus amylolyticus]